MTTKANKSLENYRRTAVLLQDLAARFNHVSIPLPKFVLVGIQSSGKTRLLSVFAKFKVGGAEKAGVGTRCPVIYTFRMTDSTSTRCRLGQSLDSLAPVNIDEVHVRVSQHMVTLGKTPFGFSDQPFYVELEGNLTLNAVIIDLPGLQPISPETEMTNSKIAAMIANYVADPRAIPLVMCGYREPDITFVRSDMSQIVRCFNNDRVKAKEAILLASKVDTVLLQLNTKLLESYARLSQEFGFDPTKIVFLSLAPEIIGGQTFLINESTTSFPEQTAYYSNKIFELEEVHLRQALKRVSIDPALYKFGIRVVVDLVEATLINALRNNFNQSRLALQKLGQDLIRRLPRTDSYDLLQLSIDYATCILEILSNSGGQVDHVRINRVLMNVAAKYPTMVDSAGLETFAQDLEKDLSRTFDEERQLNYNEQPRFSELRYNFRSFPPELGNQLDDASLGSPAMHRLLSLFGLYLMTHKLARFEVGEIRRMTGFQPGSVVTSEVIAKMVCRMRGDVYSDTVKLIKWNIWLFETQVDSVITLLRSKLKLLDQFPALRAKVEEQVKKQYFHQFAALQGEVTTDAARMFELRFSPPIASHEISGVIHLLCTARLTKTAIEPEDGAAPDAPPHLPEKGEAPAARIDDRLKQRERAAEILHQQVKNSRNVDRHADYLQNFFASITSARDALVFAEMPHQTWRESRIMDLEDPRKVDELNAAAQMIARYHLGQFYYDLVRLLYVRVAFEFGEQKIHRRVEEQVKVFIYKLFRDEKAVNRLKQITSEQIRQLGALASEIDSYVAAVDAFNDCCRDNNCPIVPTKEVSEEAQRLQKTIEDESAALKALEEDDDQGLMDEADAAAESEQDPNMPTEREKQLRREIDILLERINGTEQRRLEAAQPAVKAVPQQAGTDQRALAQLKAEYDSKVSAMQKEMAQLKQQLDAKVQESAMLKQQLDNFVRASSSVPPVTSNQAGLPGRQSPFNPFATSSKK